MHIGLDFSFLFGESETSHLSSDRGTWHFESSSTYPHGGRSQSSSSSLEERSSDGEQFGVFSIQLKKTAFHGKSFFSDIGIQRPRDMNKVSIPGILPGSAAGK